MILAMALCVGIALLGFKYSNKPIILVSSIGWIIVSLEWYSCSGEILQVVLMWMLAFGQFLVGGSR